MSDLKKVVILTTALTTAVIGSGCATAPGGSSIGDIANNVKDKAVELGGKAKVAVLEADQSLRKKFETPAQKKNLQRFLVQEGCMAQRLPSGKTSVDGIYTVKQNGYGITQKAYENELSGRCGTAESYNPQKQYPKAASELDSSAVVPVTHTKVAQAVKPALKIG